MKFGMTDQQFELLSKLVIQPLKDQGLKVYIFGSRVRSSHHTYSDVDILFTPEENQFLPPGYISTIKENIMESSFPFAVDIVNEKELASSYRTSVFSERIEL